MNEKLENIGKKSIAWSYLAVFFTVGSGIILLPFILNQMPSEMVAIWNVFQVIYSLTLLMDFGFRPSFSRNISYIFSGVQELQVNGISEKRGNDIDYGLLKDTIAAMKIFYRWMALAILLILLLCGTMYFSHLMQKYNGDKTDATIAWFVLCLVNSYNLYTLYFDSLLTGKGYVTRLQQITIVGQIVYLTTAISLIYSGLGLTAIVAAQALSILTKRILAYKTFYTKEMEAHLQQTQSHDPKKVLRIIAPNSIKVGLTSLGGFTVNKSALFIGSIFLSLDNIAPYTISIQVVDILARCGTMLSVTYAPLISQCRATSDIDRMRRLYCYSVISLLLIYLFGGGFMLLLGNQILSLINSKTFFLPTALLAALLIVSLLEQNHVIAASFIQAGNRIPFFIPSLISGSGVILLVWFFLSVANIGLWGLILGPGIIQLLYNNWKWPYDIINEFWRMQPNKIKQDETR